MNIKNLEFKNIGSYGNINQKIEFSEEGSLNLVVGRNGAGKCVHPDTIIDIRFEDEALEKEYVKFCKSN